MILIPDGMAKTEGKEAEIETKKRDGGKEGMAVPESLKLEV